MSRAQWIRGFSAWQTWIPGTVGDLLPYQGTHGLRCEETCRRIPRNGCKSPRIALIAIENQP
jgi:hypothetical protein